MIYLLSHIIEESAKLFPNKEAFRFLDQSITYLALNKQVNQLANVLRGLSVEKGDRIGIFLDRSLETAVAIHGILRAGAAYVPLDVKAPSSRNQQLIKEAGIKHLISNSRSKKKLANLLSEPLSLLSIIGVEKELPIKTISWKAVKNYPDTAPLLSSPILEKDLAYIIYTSGTTGVPKGIMHTHRSGLSYAMLSKELYNITEHDRIANHSPIHFDISTFGYFSAPLAAATTIIIPEAYTKMPASLSLLMEKEKLTVWYSVPLALTQLLQLGVLEERNLSSLRWVLYGGEPFPTKHLRQLMEAWPNSSFSNVYGPAEVNQCTYYHLKDLPNIEESIPIGVVWENTEMMIVDEADQLVNAGDIGELLICTATMMAGYWGKPELTKRGFYIQNKDAGFEKTFYRTGDIVKLNSAGQLLFLGRKDRQIKTRGYRVELDEIENIITSHSAVKEVAAYGVEDDDFGKLIEAVVILKTEIESPEKALQNYIKTHLPWYNIPSKIIFTDTIPRTTAGKINHNALIAKAH